MYLKKQLRSSENSKWRCLTITINMFWGTLELGMIYSIATLGLYLSFRILNTPDMTVDGSFVTGAAISARMCLNSHPYLGLLFAFGAGCIAGYITSLLHTKLKIQPLLAGILSMLGLYSINLKIMSNKPNIPIISLKTIFSIFENTILEKYASIANISIMVLIITLAVFLFLNTKFGFGLRATGNNEYMVRSLGVNSNVTKLVGLALSNGLVALSGAIISQYQSFTDINMGVGMIVVGLASVIIGEVLFRTRSILNSLIAVVLGAIIYRFIIAFTLQLGMPPTDLKLVSALIVGIALSIPTIKENMSKMKSRLFDVNVKKGERVNC